MKREVKDMGNQINNMVNNAAPQAVMPAGAMNAVPGGMQDAAASADTTQQMQNMNVQPSGGGLIDDVANGNAQNMNPPLQNNSLDDAKNAFSQMLAGMNTDDNTAAQPEMAQPAAGEGTDQAAEKSEAYPGVIPVQPDANPQMPFSMDDITARIQEAVQNAVENGQLADLSQNDLAAQAMSSAPQEDLSVEEAPAEEAIQVPDIQSDEFYEKFAENPGQAIMEIASALSEEKIRGLTEKLQPLMEQSEVIRKNQNIRDAIKQFAQDGHEDFAEYKDGMLEILKNGEYAMDDPSAYERAYSRAKIDKLQALNDELTRTQGRTLADYMSDDEALGQMAGNEKLRKMVIEDYLKGLSQGEKPQMITGSTGNYPSATLSTKASSIDDAARMFKKMI